MVWIVDGRKADDHVLFGKLAMARVAKLQRSLAIRKKTKEERELEADRKKVGAAIRKAVREQERAERQLIRVAVQHRRGGQNSERINRRFDALIGLLIRKAERRRKWDGLYSFHCRFTSRGLGDRRLKKAHVFRRGETIRHLRYIMREGARELSQGGIVSNISLDPDELAGFFAALEHLERQDRANANVYMSLVLSLPYELTPEGREQILREVCELLGEHELPYAGVLHAPDAGGDERNFHAHIMFSLRPCEVEGPGRYAFSAEKHSDLNDESFIKPFRHQVADILNAAMAREGHGRRFTALSNAERGLEPCPKGSGKSSPGQKAWERKQEDLELMYRERDLRQRYASALSRLHEAVQPLLNWTARDRKQEIANRHRRVMETIKQTVDASRTRRTSQLTRVLQAATIAAERVSTGSSPEVARAQPVHSYVVPDLSRDPIRRRAIAAAAWQLRSAKFPPLVRTETGFAISPTYYGRFIYQSVDRFEGEKIIQAIHHRKWDEMVTAVRGKVERASRSPFDVKEGRLSLPDDFFDRPLLDAYRAARTDPSFQRMLLELHEAWREREKKERARRRKDAEAKSAARQARKDAIGRTMNQIEKRFMSADMATIREKLDVIATAVAEGRLVMREKDREREFFCASEGLRALAEDLSRSSIGYVALVGLGRTTIKDPIDRAVHRLHWKAPPSPSRALLGAKKDVQPPMEQSYEDRSPER